MTVGGETGRAARECDYEWVLEIREQCTGAGVTFWFKNTGSLFRHDGTVEKINPYQQTGRAKELGNDISDEKRLFEKTAFLCHKPVAALSNGTGGKIQCTKTRT